MERLASQVLQCPGVLTWPTVHDIPAPTHMRSPREHAPTCPRRARRRLMTLERSGPKNGYRQEAIGVVVSDKRLKNQANSRSTTSGPLLDKVCAQGCGPQKSTTPVSASSFLSCASRSAGGKAQMRSIFCVAFCVVLPASAGLRGVAVPQLLSTRLHASTNAVVDVTHALWDIFSET